MGVHSHKISCRVHLLDKIGVIWADYRSPNIHTYKSGDGSNNNGNERRCKTLEAKKKPGTEKKNHRKDKTFVMSLV